MRAIRKQSRNFAAIIGLLLLAIGVAGYILSNQRVRFPWQEKPYTLKFAFTTAQAVTPGQGQTVRISGIQVGTISKVDLVDGKAIVTAEMDKKYKSDIHTDASALLRPKTGLKDMFIEVTPGKHSAPVATPGWTVPVSNTLPDVNPDEILRSLDEDTRDYLALLVNGVGRGLDHRESDLQNVLARFEPTHRDLARVNALVAKRHDNLRHLIHSLNLLNGKLASKSTELTSLIGASSQVFRAFASEQGSIQDSVKQLPGALRTTSTALQKVQAFADQLTPAADALRPAARELNTANKALLPLGKEITPVIHSQIRPFVRDARPVVRSLKPASQQLAKATPDLTSSFKVLNDLFNLIGYNPGGKQAPGAANRDEGYLFWIAWLQHNASAVFSSQDANGPFRALTLSAACPTLALLANQIPELGMTLGQTLLDPKVCNT